MKKNILFVCPEFYHYHTLIIDTLTNMGHKVYFMSDYAEADFVNFFLKRTKTIKHALIAKKQRQLLKLIQKKQIDMLFVIRGMFLLDDDFLKKVFHQFPDIDTVTYQWDSLECFNYSVFIKYFKCIYTFDSADASEQHINYLPLFYDHKSSSSLPIKYDVLYISSYSHERLIFLNQLKEANSYTSFKFVMYIPFFSFMKNMLNGYFRENLASFYKYLIFKPLTRKDYLNLLASSRAVIDFSHSHQSGLTMRSIETLGSQKVLITNNVAIQNEPFYNKQQIKIFKNIKDINAILKTESLQDYKPVEIDNLYLPNWLSFINKTI